MTWVLAAEIDFDDGVEYIATTTFATLGTDTPANQLFRGRLMDAIAERSVSFAVWRGDRIPASVVQELVIVNADGAFDGWRLRNIKDRTVVLRVGQYGTPYSTWAVRARLTGDRIAQASRTTLVIRFKSKLARLEKQITVPLLTAPNVEAQGSRAPVCIGLVEYCGGVLWQNGTFERFYMVSDVPIAYVNTWYGPYAFPPPGYDMQGLPPGVYGLRRRPASAGPGPDAKVCLSAFGALRLGTELLGVNGTFDNWTAGVPNGWTLTQNNGKVTQSGSSAFIDGEDVWLNYAGLTVGQQYHVEVRTSSIDSGIFKIEAGAAELYQTADTYFVGSVRCFRLTFLASTTTIRIGVPVSATSALYVDQVSIWPCTLVSQFRGWVEHLLIDRGGVAAADLDGANLNAIQSAKAHEAAYFADRGGDLAQIFYDLCDSFNVAPFEASDGKLRFATLRDPAGMSPIATIIDDDWVESLEWEDDEADGLTTSLRYARNYAPLTDAEIAQIPGYASFSPALLEQLRRTDRRVNSTVAVHSHYARAADQDPADSLLSFGSGPQSEINARCALYTVRRSFGRGALRDLPKFATLDPDTCVEIVSQRWGTVRAYVQRVALTLIGSEPIIRIRVWR